MVCIVNTNLKLAPHLNHKYDLPTSLLIISYSFCFMHHYNFWKIKITQTFFSFYIYYLLLSFFHGHIFKTFRCIFHMMCRIIFFWGNILLLYETEEDLCCNLYAWRNLEISNKKQKIYRHLDVLIVSEFCNFHSYAALGVWISMFVLNTANCYTLPRILN